MNPIDLRGLFRMLDLLVVDEKGLPVRANVHAFREGERNGERTLTGPERIGKTGSGPLLLAGDPILALIIESDGTFPVRVDPLAAPDKIVLRRGLDVTLEWTGSMPLEDLPASSSSSFFLLEAMRMTRIAWIATCEPGPRDAFTSRTRAFRSHVFPNPASTRSPGRSTTSSKPATTSNARFSSTPRRCWT